MEQVRLQKFLARAGVASRRKAEEFIQDGRVKINGEVVSELGVKISEADRIEVDGKDITPQENWIYIMLHKPVNYVSTAKDQFARPTVLDLVKEIKERIYPVGRLDYETSGLIILTNDGEFTFRLTHPSHEIEKAYIAEVEGTPDDSDIKAFYDGIEIEGSLTASAGLEILKQKNHTAVAKITLHEGRNRQVRKMCEAIGHSVISLERVSIGGVELGDLPEGQWRYLSKEEIKRLGS